MKKTLLFFALILSTISLVWSADDSEKIYRICPMIDGNKCLETNTVANTVVLNGLISDKHQTSTSSQFWTIEEQDDSKIYRICPMMDGNKCLETNTVANTVVLNGLISDKHQTSTSSQFWTIEEQDDSKIYRICPMMDGNKCLETNTVANTVVLNGLISDKHQTSTSSQFWTIEKQQ